MDPKGAGGAIQPVRQREVVLAGEVVQNGVDEVSGIAREPPEAAG